MAIISEVQRGVDKMLNRHSGRRSIGCVGCVISTLVVEPCALIASLHFLYHLKQHISSIKNNFRALPEA